MALKQFIVKKNHFPMTKITASGNLAALLIAVFGSDTPVNLCNVNISASKQGRLQAKTEQGFYSVVEA